MSALRIPIALSAALLFFLNQSWAAPRVHDPYNEGLRALKSGNTSAAIDRFSEVIRTDPTNIHVYNDRGVAYKKAGELEKAIIDYSKALDIDPNYVKALNNRGIAFTQRGEYDRAIEDFNNALKLGDLNGKVRANLGTALARKGNFTEALNVFEQTSEGAMDATALYHMAESLEHSGNSDRALKIYKMAKAASKEAVLNDLAEKKITALSPAPANLPMPAITKEKSPQPKPLAKNESLRIITTTPLEVVPAKLPLVAPRNPTLPTAPTVQIQATPERSLPDPPRSLAALEKSSRPKPHAKGELPRIVPTVPLAVVPAKPRAAATQNPTPSIAQTLQLKSAPAPARPELPESLAALEKRCRESVVKMLSQASSEIFGQGIHFLSTGDKVKALVRFEDASQLERRRNNIMGAAWAKFEAARIQADLGDRVPAEAGFAEAIKFFEQNSAFDQAITALIEAAANKKAMGDKERSKALYSRAVSIARKQGYEKTAETIEAIAAGRKPVEETAQVETAKNRIEATQKSPQNSPLNLASKPEGQASQLEATQIQTAADKVNTTATNGPAKSDSPAEVVKPRRSLTDKGKTITPLAVPGKDKPALASSTKKASDQPGEQSQKATPETTGKSSGQTEEPPRQPEAQSKPAMPSSESRQSKIETTSTPIADKAQVTADSRAGQAEKPKPGEVAGKSGTGISASLGDAAPVTKPRLTEREKPVIPQITIIKTPELGPKKPVNAKGKARDIAELKRLKEAGDEAGMINVLDRLADAFIAEKQYEKAEHALSVSMTFRDKLGRKDGLDALFQKLASVKESKGDYTGALEYLTRAAYAAGSLSGNRNSTINGEIRRVAAIIGMGPAELSGLFQQLWAARAVEDSQSETEILYLLGRAYEKHNLPNEALSFYERSSASILADKARVYERIGREEPARELYEQAMEAFKRLDYSRYLELKRKGKGTQKLSSEPWTTFSSNLLIDQQ